MKFTVFVIPEEVVCITAPWLASQPHNPEIEAEAALAGALFSKALRLQRRRPTRRNHPDQLTDILQVYM